MRTLFDVLKGLDPETLLDNGQTVDALLESGDSDLVEPAKLVGNEIYLTTESGDIYTAADPAYTIVK